MNGIEAGKAYVKFLLDDKDLKKGLAKIGSQLTKVGAIGTAATAPLVAVFVAATNAFISAGDELDKMSARTGFAAEALSELKYAAGQSGTSIGAIEKAAKKMQVGILDASRATGSLYESLEALGVNLEALKALTPEEQFLTLSKAIADVEDPTMRAALAQKVFGRAGTELLPMLAAGSKGIEDLRQRAHELGVVLTEEDATAAAILGDNLDDLKLQVQTMAIQIGSAISGPLTDFAKSMQPILADGVAWIKNNKEMIVLIAKLTAIIGAASIALVGLGTMMTLLALHPVLATIIGITAAVVALNEAMKDLSDWLSGDSQWANEMEAKFAEIKGTLDAVGKELGKEPMRVGPSELDAAELQANALAFQQKMEASLANAQPSNQLAMQSLDPSTSHDISRIAEIGEASREILERIYDLMRRGKGGLTVGGF